jgi:hypothetical protein
MTNASSTLRYVLADNERDLGRFSAAVGSVFESSDDIIALPDQVEQAPDIFRTVWNVPQKKLVIEHVADNKMGISWVSLVGDLRSVAMVAEALSGHITWHMLPTLLDEAKALSPVALVKLALGTNALWNDEVANILRSGLQSGLTDVRAAAAEAIYILSWPALYPDVAEALAKEQDEGIASMLDLILQRLIPQSR